MSSIKSKEIGLIGYKVGTTSVFADDGTLIPVTLINFPQNNIIDIRMVSDNGLMSDQIMTELLQNKESREIQQLINNKIKGLSNDSIITNNENSTNNENDKKGNQEQSSSNKKEKQKIAQKDLAQTTLTPKNFLLVTVGADTASKNYKKPALGIAQKAGVAQAFKHARSFRIPLNSKSLDALALSLTSNSTQNLNKNINESLHNHEEGNHAKTKTNYTDNASAEYENKGTTASSTELSPSAAEHVASEKENNIQSESSNESTNLFLGKKIDVNHFAHTAKVNVSGRTIGKGFSGVIKRHNFAGLEATHGVSISHRSHGSTGQNQDPGRVFKGKKMAGHDGNLKTTMKNLKVVNINLELNILAVKGCVPGAKGTIVTVYKNQ